MIGNILFNSIAGLPIVIVAFFALPLFCLIVVLSILVSFISENILPLSAMAAAYLLVRYLGL